MQELGATFALDTRDKLVDLGFGGRKLGTDLVASLQSVRHLLMEAPPRRIPLSGDEIAPLLYADAFFVQDGKRRRFSDLDANAHNTKPFLESLTPETTNGWGVVVARVGAPTLFARGSVPSYVLARLKKKKTFIFFLEVVAQCIGLWIFAPELGRLFWVFVDNMSARFALTRGYSKDADANAVISLFWHFAASNATSPWFEHVPSAAQLADGVSRDDLTLSEAYGWGEVGLDLTEVWAVVQNVIESGSVAQQRHLEALDKAASAARKGRSPLARGRGCGASANIGWS